MPTNITIKGIPDDVYEKLKKQAEVNHRSINSEVIVSLKKTVESTRPDTKYILERAKKIRDSARGSLTMEEIQQAIEEGRP